MRKNAAMKTNAGRRRGKVVKKAKCKYLYILFYYLGERIEESTGDIDTPDKVRKWEQWLDRAIQRIDEGTFIYAEHFPNANPKKKALFAQLEGRELEVSPKAITMGEVIRKYRDEIVPNFPSESKQEAYLSKIRSRILPYFEDMTFADVTRNEIANFICELAGTNRRED